MEGRDIKKIFGENLKRLRTERGLDQNIVARNLNMSKTAVSEWESGKKLATAGNLEKLADFYNVPKSYLLAENSVPYASGVHLTAIPIVGRISCGNGALAYEEVEGYEKVPASWAGGGEFFFLRVKGDSMINARIHEGDLVLIRKQEDIEDGEIGVVIIDGEGYLKRVYKKEKTIVLQSENPDYPPIICDKEGETCRIVGKLKKIIIST